MKRNQTFLAGIFSIDAIFILFAILFAISGCATSSGSLFETEVSAAPSERRSGNTEKPDGTADEDGDEQEEESGIAVRTSPSRAEIFVDGWSVGTSPILLAYSTGRYHIIAEKEGYHAAELFVSHREDERQELHLELERITGALVINVEPRDADVRTGFLTIAPDVETRFGVGSHSIEVSAFGYETTRQTVVVSENRTTYFSVVLDEAPFRVDLFSVRTDRFSPRDPGSFGSSSFRIAVSGPGVGQFHYTDSAGRAVTDPVPIRFTERWTTIRWDGRGADGATLPDGRYRFYLTGDNAISESYEVTIDRSVSRRTRPVYGGVAGTLFSPLPGSFPRGELQGALLVLGHVGPSAFMFPVVASLRFGVGEREEIVASGGAIVRGPAEYAGDSIAFGSLSWSIPLVRSVHIASSVIAKLAYFDNRAIDPLANFSGLGAAVPVSVSAGPVTVVVTPELVVSPVRVTHGDPSRESEASLSAWGYAKAAAVLDVGRVSLAVSAALRTAPFDAGFSVDWPAAAGAELHVTRPESALSLSAGAVIQWHPVDGWYITSGGGLAFLFR